MRTRQILEHDLDLSDEKLSKLQLLAAQGVLTIQSRVDEGRLKRRKLDVLPRLIELIKAERAKQGRTIDIVPNP
jgi:hypothetical protein